MVECRLQVQFRYFRVVDCCSLSKVRWYRICTDLLLLLGQDALEATEFARRRAYLRDRLDDGHAAGGLTRFYLLYVVVKLRADRGCLMLLIFFVDGVDRLLCL